MGRDPWWRPRRCKGAEAETGLCQWEERLGAGQRGCVRGAESPCGRDSGPTLPPLQVDMLYEEALYTVLHRAGTMGPDQVDDEEALLSYLQQVRPGPRPLGWPGPSLGVAETLSPTCLCHCRLNNTHRIAPRTSHTHRCTGMPRKMDRHTDTFKQKNTQTDGHSCKEHWKRQVDRCRTHTEGWTDTQRKAERTNQQVDRPLSSAVCAPPTP